MFEEEWEEEDEWEDEEEDFEEEEWQPSSFKSIFYAFSLITGFGCFSFSLKVHIYKAPAGSVRTVGKQ